MKYSLSPSQIEVEMRVLVSDILKRTSPMPIQSQHVIAGFITYYADEIGHHIRNAVQRQNAWAKWATWVWIGIIIIGVAWEIAGLLFSSVPTLSELVTATLQYIGPYGRVAFVVIWLWLAWHFLTGKIFSKQKGC